MQNQENIDWHMARSHVYGLFGSLLSDQPTVETIEPLMCPEAVDYFETMFTAPDIGTRFKRLVDQYYSGKISVEQVALDFEGLMRVPGAAYTYPFESTYRARRKGEKSVKWGGLCGSQARDAERFYHSEGLEPRYDRIDFADHIGAELAFMSHMCRKTAEAMQTEQMGVSEHLQAKQQEFAHNHLLTWVADFSAELKAKAATPFFRVVADLLAAFAKLEKEEPITQ